MKNLLPLFLLLWLSPVLAEVLSERYLQHGLSYDGPQVVYREGRPWVAYLDEQSQLRLLALRGPKQEYLIEAQGKPELENTYIGLWPQQDRLLAVWRPKYAQDIKGEPRGTKIIRASVLEPGATAFTSPQVLSQGGGAFNPTSQAWEGNRVYLTWEDERTQRYGVFLNYSEDFGKTWLADDLRMDNLHPDWTRPAMGEKQRVNMTEQDAEQYAMRAFNPFVTVVGQRVIVGWIEQYPGEGNLLRMRQSQDGGKTWCNAYTILQPQVPIYNPKILRVGDELMIVFYGREAGIMSLRSKDQGLTWQGPTTLPHTEVIGGQGYSIAQNTQGTLCLAWPGPNTLGERFADVFTICSNNNGQTWNEPVRMDTDSPMSSHSLIPVITLDEAGRILVAWRDSRNVRADVYVRYSMDAGKTWSASDYRLDDKPGERLSSYIAVATDGQGEFTLVWEDALDDTTATRYKLAHETLRLPELTLASAPQRKVLAEPKELLAEQDKQRQARLVERVKAYWQARVNDDYKTMHELLDPYYRVRVSMLQYGSMMERYKFHQFEIIPESVSVSGNRAHVELTAAFEGRQTVTVGGQVVKEKPSQRELKDKWVWVDGDWFKVWEINGQGFLPL